MIALYLLERGTQYCTSTVRMDAVIKYSLDCLDRVTPNLSHVENC
jgi:hypothetical protein